MATRYNYTGGIVTNGLVLNLDAAKTDSYPGTGTTWRDLSGFSNNGTLTNGPTFSGIGKQASIVFDGVDDYVDCGNNSSLNINGDLTVSVWLNATGRAGNNIIFAKHSLPSNIANYEGYLNGTGIYWWDGITFRNTGLNITSNTWCNVTYVRTGSSLKTYFNYSTSSTISVTFQGPVSGNLLIGRDQNRQELQGRISSLQIYNRALTAQEILQNYNATKGRFGLS
jgi:hypothetical protein